MTSSVRLSSDRSLVRTNQIACIMQLIVEHGIVACSKLMNFFFLTCSSPRGELTTGNVTKISVLSSLQVPYLFTASPLRDSTQGIFFLDISATDSSTDRLMYLLHLVILEKNECVSKKNWLKQ